PPSPPPPSTLSLHDALPICGRPWGVRSRRAIVVATPRAPCPGRHWSGSGRREPLGVTGSLGLRVSLRQPRGTIQSFTGSPSSGRSEEHTSELQSRFDLVCRL